MQEQDVDTSRLEEEVAKVTDEEPASETTTEETSEEKDDSTRTDASLKTEKEETETSEKEETTDEQPPFHTHPAWIRRNEKLKQLEEERNEDLNRAEEAQEIKEKLGGMSADEILKLRNAGELLRKYPELAQKVQKIIDEHNYGNEETIREISNVKQKQEELEQKLLLKDYDEQVDKLISKHKVDKDLEPYVKEFLDNRVVSKKIKLADVPKVFENVLKDIEKIRRKTLASHIETKDNETKVPKSPADKGKVITTKRESGELGDVVAEMTEGLKARSSSFKEE